MFLAGAGLKSPHAPYTGHETIDATLSQNPEDAVTHANQGWVLLHQQQPLQAMKIP